MRVAWVILLGAVACTEPDPLRNAHLAFLTPPGTQEGRVAFTPPVRVAIEDPAGNVIPVDTTVELDLVDQPIWPAGQPNIDLQGTTLVRSVAGIATFNDVSLSLPANSYRIRALVGADLSVTSEPFTVRLTFVSVSAGYFHSCGITIADYAYCWGINGSGELGDGTNLSRHIPNPTTGATQFRQVTASNAHSCGVTPDDTAYCWPGSVSAPTEDPPRIPTLVAGLGGLDRVSAAKVTGRTCGITTTGASYCWGGSGPTFAVGGAPVFVRIATGSAHTCGLTADGTAYCWGWNGGGQLGDNTGSDHDTPAPVSGTVRFKEIAAGDEHTCAIAVDGAAWCWGANIGGSLGDGTSQARLVPTPVAGGLTFTQVSAGGVYSCGVASGGLAYCWGSNASGQLGDGTTTSRPVPTPVSGHLTFTEVSAAVFSSCGLTSDGVYCWGYANGGGLLGDGSDASSLVPKRIVQ